MKFFSIRELTKSQTAIRKNIDNSPTKEEEHNLQQLIDNVLDPLREAYGRPIVVTSGYRCKDLNSLVGGAKNSDHLYGYAADIRSVEDTRRENKKIFDLILELNLPFKQLINEHNYDWVHVSYCLSNNKKQILNIK